jgi:hypothetical protein
MEGDLGTVDGGIAGESYFDWNIEDFVVVGMDVEVEGGRQESAGVQVLERLFLGPSRSLRHL